MALTEDQRIVAKAIDLIVGVSPGVLARARRNRDRWGYGGTRPSVSAYDFAELADAIEQQYPGMIERVRADQS